MVKSKLPRRTRRWLAMGEFAALGAGAVILLVFLASALDGALLRSGQGAAVVTSVLVDLVNTDRQSNNVGELTVNPVLVAVAQLKANDMAEKGYFAHKSPEGHDPWYWFAKGGYKFSHAGENLAVDFSDSADVERAWMNSPTHRANLLNGRFTEIGIATAVGTYKGRQTTFVVQVFGTPARTPTAAAPENLTPTAAPTEIALATTEPTPAPTPVAASEPVPSEVATVTPTAVLGSGATGLAAPAPTVYDNIGLTALWNNFAASPKTTLRYAYYLFGLLILVALVIATGNEIKHHHAKHVALAFALLVLMGSLFIAADLLVFTTPTVTEAAVASGGTS